MESTVRFGYKPLSQFIAIDDLRHVWTVVDEAGFDHCWVFDHFTALGPDPAGDIFEGWSLLAAMAQASRRMAMGALVTGSTYRHPAVLAKMATTVDHLSGGRLVVGLGAGGHHADLGLPTAPPAELLGRFEETCQVLKLLWTQPSVTFTGRHFQLDGALSNPKPMQRPHPPLWLGSSGERGGLRVVARHADVWISASPYGTDVAELVRLSRIVDDACERIGRDPATIRRAVQLRLSDNPDETLRLVESHIQAGFSEVVLAGFARGSAAVGAAEGAALLLPRLRNLGEVG